MTSPARSFARDEASVTSPFRNAFASSSTTKPSHSPYLKRRSYTSNDSPYTGYDTQSKTSRPPDAISTSSSTLVNAESTSDYRPWEVRSESSTISLDSATISRGGRATPTLSALDEIGTLPSIHISPLPNRAARVNRQQAQSRNGGQLGRRSLDSSRTRARIVRQLCPDDCRCSDQDINLGLCRRVVGSSSSSSDSGSLSVGVHPTRARASNTSTDLEADMPPNAILNNLADHSRQSSHSQSESRSQGRDFDKDPILVPRSSRTKPASRSAVSNYQHSFDQLQRGLDELESSESDVETNADQVLAAQRRAESMARWTARRASLSRSSIDGRSTELKPEQPPEAPKDSPVRSTRYMASDVPLLRHTSESKTVEDNTSLSIPLKATPGRKSIAAVFESMQKEREVRAAEEHKRWQEKQARRERERAARAFGASLRRRTSASSSQFDSPASGGTSAFDTPSSQNNSNTTYRSMVSRATPHPSRSPVSSLGNASPLHSSPNPPKVDESAASDHVETRHLGEEAATWVLETLAEDEEQVSNDQDSDAQPEAVDITEETQEDEAFQTTPQTKQASAFAFTPQPMTLDLSPVRSVSDFSSPASSPRKNAHRRQNTNTVSVAARIPPASLGAARQRLNQVLRSSPDESSRIQPLTTSAEVEQQSHRELAQRIGYDNPQTPVNGILSSARKGLPQFSAARRGHSVRFSPRPDYRSDSGSWDESGTQSNGGENSREAAVESRLLPAKEIVIPEILAGASKPLQVSAGTDADMVEVAAVEVEEEDKGLTERFVEQVHRVSPAKSERMESISKPHTVPALAQLQDVSSTSTSQSVRFPGSYVTTPVKKYSRHVIRPSPKTPRTSNVHPSVAASRAPLFAERMSAAEEFGLFPAAGSRGSDIPRESTPPPPQQSRQNRLMGADDPHSFSPRSPRPADLGTRQFGQFHTGSSSDDSGGSTVEANTKANERAVLGKSLVNGDGDDDGDGVQASIGRILQRVEASHNSKLKRMELGKKLTLASERVRDVAASRTAAAAKNEKQWSEIEERERQDKVKADELRREVLNALSMLAERLSQLQGEQASTGVVRFGGDDSSLTSLASIRSIDHVDLGRKALPRWAMVMAVIAQCALIAFLLGVAERKAQHMRMLESSFDYRTLYNNPRSLTSSHTIEWNAVATDPYLTPLLTIPGLNNLAKYFPLLPSSSFPNLHNSEPPSSSSSLWSLYRTYIRLNGFSPFLIQLVVYALAQVLSLLLLLCLAPFQVIYFLVHP